MGFFTENDLPPPVGDHFDGFSDALRECERRGINSGVVMISGLQQLAGEQNLTSRDIVIHMTGLAYAMLKEKTQVELVDREAREYMAKYEAYLGALPLAVQNDMRRELEAKFRELLQK
jgi:hypothetical protein